SSTDRAGQQVHTVWGPARARHPPGGSSGYREDDAGEGDRQYARAPDHRDLRRLVRPDVSWYGYPQGAVPGPDGQEARKEVGRVRPLHRRVRHAWQPARWDGR